MPASGTSFASIFTDTVATPFDFSVSNNTVYFSNAHAAKKWDPVNGLSNWGIAIGSSATSTSAYCGTAADGGGANVWTNPTRAQGAPDGLFAENLIPSTSSGTIIANILNMTNYGISIGSSNTVVGIQVNLTYAFTSNTSHSELDVFLLFNGSPIGSTKIANQQSGLATVSFGSSSDLWGTTLSPGIINSSTFGIGISARASRFLGVPATITLDAKVDAAQITVFSIGGPTVTVSGSAGTFSATSGYIYEYCYGNTATGHISSPTPVSNNTGAFTGKLNVSIPLTASTDPQVNQIRVFRTTDGGGSPLSFFELPTSPYPNTTQNVTDAAPDTALNVSSIAPTATFNDPPTPGRATQYFSGRFWLFNGNKVAFSGLEEIVQGVPEESFPSGTAGNYWTFDQPVQAEGVAGSGQNQTLGVFCGGRIYGIVGNTLDTFQRYTISKRRGCRAVTGTAELGGMIAWLDSSNQIWASNGSDLQELSTDIRPDLVGINPATCSMTFHVAGRFHWLVFSTGTKLFVYDMDLEQWMPPWSFACQYIYSGETSPGNYVLMAATATSALQLNITQFNDNGVTYQPVLNFGNLAVVPDFGRRFSYVAAGIYDEPSRTGYPNIFQITNNNQNLADVLVLFDDDPKQGTYTSIAANLQDTSVTYNRKNGTFMTQRVYHVTQNSSRWVSLQVKLANADQVDNVYECFMAYKALGGR